MREPILKAVAMPPRLFWAPFMIGLANFTVHIALMFMLIGIADFNPLWMITSALIIHSIIVSYSAKEPHLSRMCESWGKSGPAMTHSIYENRGNKFAP